jgi:hypothetical protein
MNPEEIAARLEAMFPGWAVVYGAFTHHYVAMPTGLDGHHISSSDPNRLARQLAIATRPSPSAVPSSGLSSHHERVSTVRALGALPRAGLCFAAVALLAADARRRGPLARREEQWMERLADGQRPRIGAARLLTWGGTNRFAISVAAGIGLARTQRHDDHGSDRAGRIRRGHAAAPMLTVVSGIIARYVFCESFARPRPPCRGWHVRPGGHSFPSRHTTVAALVAGVAAEQRPFAASMPAAAIVGATRLYLGVHWPSDVVAGWLFALGWLALADEVTARLSP